MIGVVAIENAFKFPNKSKTLKTEIRNGISLDTAINSAFNYVRSANPLDVTRIEFKFDNCYIVVARLKDTP